MTFSRRIGLAPIWITLAIALAIVLAVGLATPRPAGAFIDEIIAALCNGGDEVIPPGQVREGGQSFVRALQASGFIEDIDFTNFPIFVTINFDPDVPNSKFRSTGGDVPIPDGFAPGIDLVLSPGVEPDPNFPAHAACRNLNP